MKTPALSFRITTEPRELLELLEMKTRLSKRVIVEDGIRLVAKREKVVAVNGNGNGKNRKKGKDRK